MLTSADVPGDNAFGPVFHDEELLAKEFVHYLGQPVVAVAGTTREAVAAAKALVAIRVEPLHVTLTGGTPRTLSYTNLSLGAVFSVRMTARRMGYRASRR